MPEADLFLQGFNIAVGNTFDSYKISNISIGHHNVVLYNEYSYPIDVTFEWQGVGSPSITDANTMLKTFFNHINKVKIIHTPSGRPYKCVFVQLGTQASITEEGEYNKVHFICTGYAKRIGAKEAERVESTGVW